MRYLIAMIFAAAAALAATVFLSSRVATWVVARFAFDNPDQVGDLHSIVFMTTNVLALTVGWTIGWYIAGRRWE